MEKSLPSQDAQENGSENLDFKSAEHYLGVAKMAYEKGDLTLLKVARQMILICLGIKNENYQGRQWSGR